MRIETNKHNLSQIKNDPRSQKRENIFEFDKLRMYFGEPYDIKTEPNGKIITVFQPTLGDIIEFGEKKFYSMLNIFIGNPTSYRLQLWENKIDWNKISDYELFCMLIKGLKDTENSEKEDTSLLFGNLDFSLFDIYDIEEPIETTDENENTKKEFKKSILLFSEELELAIPEKVYLEIAEYLRTMFGIFPKVEKAKGKATKQAIIDEDKMNLAKEKNKVKNSDSSSMLLPMISSCVNHPGFKYKKSELKQLGIVEFMDSVQRLQIYENTIALLRGMYSGMIDTKGIDKEALNFMREVT